MNPNGQTAMLELLFGALLVLAMLAAVANSFEGTFRIAQTQGQMAQAFDQADRLLVQLLRSPGNTLQGTTDWETETDYRQVESVGLASQPLVVSAAKLRALKQWAATPEGYQQLRETLRIGDADFSISVLVNENGFVHPVRDKTENGTVFLEIGKPFFEIAQQRKPYVSLVVERAVILDYGHYQDFAGKIVPIDASGVIVRMKVYRYA